MTRLRRPAARRRSPQVIRPEVMAMEARRLLAASAFYGTYMPAPGGDHAGVAIQVTFTGVDVFGNLATDDSGPFTLKDTDPDAEISPVSGNLVNGVATVSLVPHLAGNQALTLTAASGASGIAIIDVSPGLTRKLVVAATAGPATAGVAVPVVVSAVDQYGNLADDEDSAFTYSSSDPGVAAGSGTLVAGKATANVVFTTAGTQTLTASGSAGLAASTATSVSVSAGAATQLVATTGAGTSVVAGSTVRLTVKAEDAYGNLATGYSGPIALTSTDPRATLPAGPTLAGGIGTFDATLVTAGPQALAAWDPAATLAGATAGVAVTPGAATQFVFNTPKNLAAGDGISVVVSAMDAYGNAATGYDGTVVLTIGDPKSPATIQATAVAGVATFTPTIKFLTGGPRALTASDAARPGLTGSTTVTVSAIVRGTAFLDDDGDGVQDAGEAGLAGRTFFLDLDGDGFEDVGEPEAVTDATGAFAFSPVTVDTRAIVPARSKDPADRNAVIRVAVASGGGATGMLPTLGVAVVPTSSVAPIPSTAAPLVATAQPDDDSRFVAALYRAVLGRQGSDIEVARWVGAMSVGLTREQVAARFVNSPEHRREQVESYYRTFLLRRTDLFASTWVDALLAGASEEAVVGAILNSLEYQGRYATATSFIASLYDGVLGRQADPRGAASWAYALGEDDPRPVLPPGAGGDPLFYTPEFYRADPRQTRAEVAAAFIGSAEANEQHVESLYRGYLHRRREDSSYSPWARQLDADLLTATDVAIGILASAEFYDSARSGLV